jgi:hypothetical protein
MSASRNGLVSDHDRQGRKAADVFWPQAEWRLLSILLGEAAVEHGPVSHPRDERWMCRTVVHHTGRAAQS